MHLPVFDPSKAKAAILYVGIELSKRTKMNYADLYQLLKTIYFADRKHLARYGRPITGDFYVAMGHGPVPSKTYDMLKIVRGDSYSRDPRERGALSVSFDVEEYNVIPKQRPDMDEFSETDLECLNEAIDETASLSFGQLKKKSHDNAFEKAAETNKNAVLSFEDIARAGGADDDMSEYITLQMENESLLRP